MPPTDFPRGARAARALALAGTLVLVAACSSKTDECVDTRTYFSEQVWGPVFSRQCLSCHGPGGRAQIENAKLKLLPASYPGFLDANLDNLGEVARLEVAGVSELLLKPLGELGHGGGPILSRDSADYRALSQLVLQLKSPTTCAPKQGGALASLALLDPFATLRKAALNLTGRLPTPAERAALEAGGEAALPSLVDALLREDAFYERLKEIWNDVLLTDRYLSYNGRAVGLLDGHDWPGRGDGYYNQLSDSEKWYANRAIGREPLELVAHVVREGRPFSEILTADYTLVNRYSAGVYGVTGLDFGDSAPTALKEAALSLVRGGQPTPLPHAGILTTAVFLNRFPTTPTNRNRHRARMVLNLFLATDILKVGDRPIDPTAATQYPNPTREDPACVTCHRIIDPIAGGFQKYDDYDQDKWDPAHAWHDEMWAPGYGPETMQTSDMARATPWLAARVAGDPRFVMSVLSTMYRGLTGVEPVEYPTDASAPDYASRLKAFEAQDAVFRHIGDAFVAADQDLRVLVRELVLSPYFRAATATAELSPAAAAELEGVGPGRLLTPEMLSRKLAALFGVSWVRGWDRAPYLLNDYRILYGGIDSDIVTKRLSVPNGVIAGVAARMANEVSCVVVPYDFGKPAGSRILFPEVTPLHEPEAATGDPVPGAIATVRKAIAALHGLLLGEMLLEGDPELERTYQLFLQTWREGKAQLASRAESADLPWPCQANKDPATGAELPEAQKVVHDPSYTIRAWMAVVTYLLLDYRFLHE